MFLKVLSLIFNDLLFENLILFRASKSGTNVRDPILGPKCPYNIFGEKRPINIINNEPYSVYTLYYDQLLSILMDLVHFSSESGRKLVRLCLSNLNVRIFQPKCPGS